MTVKVQRSIRLEAKSKKELDRVTGNRGEILYDNTAQTLRIFDGQDVGGIALLKADLSNIAGGTGGVGNDVDFGNKNLVATSFEGNLTGNVTGTVSDISNHTLDSLGGVNTTGASSGQVLYFTGVEWQATTLSSSFNGGNVGGITNFLNALQSTSTTTGGVTISGGLGIAKNINAGGSLTLATDFNLGGNITLSNGTPTPTTKFSVTGATGNTLIAGTLSVGSDLSIRSQSTLYFYDADNTQYIAFKAPSNVTGNKTFILPGQDGDPGQVLQTDGAGNLSWVTMSTGGGGGGGGGVATPPGGSTTQVQFNNAGAFAGDSDFTFDSATNTLAVTNVTATLVTSALTGDVTGNVTGNLTGDVTGNVAGNVTGDVTGNVSGDITSTGTSSFADATISSGAIDNAPIGATTANTGAFTQLSASGAVSVTDITDSSDTSTGAVTVSGGIGVALNANIGGSATVNNTITANGNITTNSNFVVNNTPTQATHATNKRYVDSRSLAMSIALGS
jgi:hypothetical protein